MNNINNINNTTNNDNKYLTVSALNKYIAYKLDTDIALKKIYIKGEISNSRISKGHLFFVLKDDESEISSIIFYNVASKLTFIPKDGMKVLIEGTITPYMKKGSYNLVVNQISEYGQGLIYQRFLELKQKLEKEGLFDVSHKKKIPSFPERIGVITSETGDALHDIVSTITKRYPIAQVFLYPALVQGSVAPNSLIKALKKAEYDSLVDVLIIARGGGSIEDLDCFNDEKLARVIYEASIPIVSGVGHENDFTICDFVSDERCPTPTGAAVRVTPDKQNLIDSIINLTNKMKVINTNYVSNLYNRLERITNSYYLRSFDNIINNISKDLNLLISKMEANSPLAFIDKSITNVDNLIERLKIYNLPLRIENLNNEVIKKTKELNDVYTRNVTDSEEKFFHIIEKLGLVNPLNIMKKGYTLVYKENSLITTKNDLQSNDNITLKFHDGEKKAIII